jgi:hypothetical protein
MALQDEITRIKQAKADIKASIEAKGGSVGDGLIDTYASAIDNLPSGGGDIYEYFYEEAPSYSYYANNSGYLLIKKMPLIDTSNVENMRNMFYGWTNLTAISQLNSSKVENMNSMFYNCKQLTTVPQLDASKVINIVMVFQNCSNLINFGGFKNLGMAYLTTQSANYSLYTLTLSSCTKLTHDSLMNVINGLYDIASIGVQTQKIVLGSTNKAKLTAEEINSATAKGWSVS